MYAVCATVRVGIEDVELYREEKTAERFIQLMPDPSTYRLSPRAKRQLKQLSESQDKSDAEILEIAITHLLATLENDEGVRMTVKDDGSKRHKRPPSDAA